MKRAMPFLKKLGRIFLRLAVILAVLLVILIGVLKLIERSQDQLKQGLEGYLSQTIGHPVEIEDFQKTTFFPDINIEFGNLYAWAVATPEEKIMTLEEVHVTLPFWSVLLQQGQFKQVSLQNLQIDPIITGSVPLSIERLEIDPLQPELVATAKLDDDLTLMAHIPIKRKGGGYALVEDPLSVSGTLTQSKKTQGRIELIREKGQWQGSIAFASLYARDLTPLLGLLEGKLNAEDMGTVTVTVDKLVGTNGRNAGSYDFAPLSLDAAGAIQPFSCLAAHDKTIKITDDHPCAGYLARQKE